MGTIRIDGQDIGEASVASVRDSIAVVSQDVFIFDDTARNNIRYGRSGASEDEIVAAARAARCHDFIMTLPNGYDTRLGFLGQTLSGGQKQRIAIARAFLRRAPILLLDEATSSLDPKTDMEIQDAMESLMAGRTTVIIAHRLSTVMKANDTIVLEQGSVVARGSHAELIEHCPTYRQLFGV
jgi:ABC-type multidrug transport system fused ATPase/permease subunit